jgi:hypothetical protein
VATLQTAELSRHLYTEEVVVEELDSATPVPILVDVSPFAGPFLAWKVGPPYDKNSITALVGPGPTNAMPSLGPFCIPPAAYSTTV